MSKAKGNTNPKLTILLIIAMVVVWTLVLIRFFAYGNDSEMVTMNTEVVHREKSVKNKVNVELSLKYEDPFFTKIRTNSDMLVSSENSHEFSGESNDDLKLIDIRESTLPRIFYKGVLKNESKDHVCGILLVDGIQYFVSAGDVKGEIQVMALCNDSVMLRYKRGQLFCVKR